MLNAYPYSILDGKAIALFDEEGCHVNTYRFYDDSEYSDYLYNLEHDDNIAGIHYQNVAEIA